MLIKFLKNQIKKIKFLTSKLFKLTSKRKDHKNHRINTFLNSRI